MTTDDPNFAPYPGRYEVARIKGIPPNEDPVLLDITGEADVQERIDKIREIVERGPIPDGGLSWNHESRVVTVRLVAAVDGTSPEVERLKEEVLAEAEEFTVEFQEDLTVEFQSVAYSRQELLDLADHIFFSVAPGRQIAGGWSTSENRVEVLIGEGDDETQTLIEALDDKRIVIQIVPPGPWEVL
ncbi:hypothetical protein AB0F43_04920 [Kribbella sp. NPDC023972]|uniref:hypothetical protein n=1 Tax=Kribbella sp. NPDC023972 TaxID=3154795 RepID=UPI0033DA4B5C